MRKKRPRKMRTAMYEISDGAEPRPATANLEAPIVLDSRLIDKLDMSMINKESLNVALKRLSLIKAATVIEPPIMPNLAQVPINISDQQPSNAKLRTRFAPISQARNHRKSSLNSPEIERKTKSSGLLNIPDVKKLDDNNNKNNQQQQQLSPVRPRGSRSMAGPCDAASFASGLARRKPTPKSATLEACRSCVRAALPERFHTHPDRETSLLPPAYLSANASIIPVLMTSRSRTHPPRMEVHGEKRNSLQSPETTARSDEPVSFASATSTSEGGTAAERILRRGRRLSSATSTKTSEDKSVALTTKRGPRTVTCYVCGRDFGSASFPIHEPKCLEKWHRENKAMPSSQRRNEPQRPNVSPDHENWNAIAWEESQAQLVPCPKCKRTFFPDRLAVHERTCRVINKGNSNSGRIRNSPLIVLQVSKDESVRYPESPLKISLSEKTSKNDQNFVGLSARKSSRIAVREKSAYKRPVAF